MFDRPRLCARALPASTRLLAMSTPKTFAPSFAAGKAVVPSPLPRSRTSRPSVIPDVFTSSSPLSLMLSAMRVKSPFSQSALFAFMAGASSQHGAMSPSRARRDGRRLPRVLAHGRSWKRTTQTHAPTDPGVPPANRLARRANADELPVTTAGRVGRPAGQHAESRTALAARAGGRGRPRDVGPSVARPGLGPSLPHLRRPDAGLRAVLAWQASRQRKGPDSGRAHGGVA